MKSDLSDKDFKDLEKKCLLLDILLDCEEYDEFDTVLRSLNGFHNELSLEIHEAFKKLTEQKEIKEAIKQKISGLDKTDSSGDVSCFKIIITSKYVRRLIKDKERTLETKEVKFLFQALTEKLLKKIPQKPEAKSGSYNRDNQFRIVFLNEISACSESNLASGYAEMALDELGELDTKWNLKNGGERIRHPYELYALYNKGLALHHDHTNIERAIDTLLQIKLSFKSFEKFKDEYNLEGADLYAIFFWLIYIPTMNLLAEAFNDLYSSFDLEKIIKEGLERINKERDRVSLDQDRGLTKDISNYYRVKFNTQFIFSLIDSGNFDDKVQKINPADEWGWLGGFKEYFDDNNKFSDFIDNCRDKCEPDTAIGIQMCAARALFLLEYARRDKEIGKSFISKSFEICFLHTKEKYYGSDWSDFAITFLQGVEFALENYDDDTHPFLENLKLLEISDPQRFENCYRTIFHRINEEEWIARKNKLVEKFLICQEKHLGQDVVYYRKRPPNIGEGEDFHIRRDKLLRYQIELIENILGKESARRFKKKWPECEKEKLVKNLITTLKSFGYENILAWWHVAKANLAKEIECTQDFEQIVEDMQNKLYNNIYSLPEDNALDRISEFIQNNMNADFYTKKLRLNAEEFYDHLIYKSCRPWLKNRYALTVLRRWQSFTPALSMGSEVGHKGGGYFVYKTDEKGEIVEGLVIDPGFDFLENFFDEGFSIKDINAILMTHSHRDHSSDFMSILTLVHEMNKCGKRVFKDKWENRKLVLFMTEGCYQNFAEQIRRNTESFNDIIRVNKDTSYPDEGKKPFLKSFRLKAQKANHNDLTDHDSVGYIIANTNKKWEPLIGFTGDTQWFFDIEKHYKKCQIICMNLGGVVDIFKKGILLSDLGDKKKNEASKRILDILLTENHLYLPGFYLMAQALTGIRTERKPKLLIISELCEEMKGGLRTDLSHRIGKALRRKIPVLPEDIGLTVILDKKSAGYVLCKVCQSVWPPEKIVPVETDKDNAIVYLCKDHYRQMREGYSIPKINELELDINELRKPLIK